jgi:hypothetical protein
MKPLFELALLFIFVIILVILFKDDLIALVISEGLLLAFFGMVVWYKYEMFLERKQLQSRQTQQQQQSTQQIQQQSTQQIQQQQPEKSDDDDAVDFGYDPRFFPSKEQVRRAYNDNTTYVGPNGQVRCLGGINDQFTRQLQIRSRRDEQNDIAASKMTADTFRKYFEPELVTHSNRCWWEDNPELEPRMQRDGVRFY